jgi:hypothetical protein
MEAGEKKYGRSKDVDADATAVWLYNNSGSSLQYEYHVAFRPSPFKHPTLSIKLGRGNNSNQLSK